MEVTEKEDEKKVKREEERQARRGRFREGWGEWEDMLLMPQRAGRLTLTFIPQSSSSGSFPRTHPTAHRPGEVYEHDWSNLPTMKFPETALFIRCRSWATAEMWAGSGAKQKDMKEIKASGLESTFLSGLRGVSNTALISCANYSCPRQRHRTTVWTTTTP